MSASLLAFLKWSARAMLALFPIANSTSSSRPDIRATEILLLSTRHIVYSVPSVGANRQSTFRLIRKVDEYQF